LKPVVTVQISPNENSDVTVLSFCPITGYEPGVGAAVLRSFESLLGERLPQYGSVDIQWPVVPLGELFSGVSLKDGVSLPAIIDEVISQFKVQHSDFYNQVINGQRKLICIGYSFGAYLATLFSSHLSTSGNAPQVPVIVVDQAPPGSLSTLTLRDKLEYINCIFSLLNLPSVSLPDSASNTALNDNNRDTRLLEKYIAGINQALPQEQERKRIFINVFINFFIMCDLTIERMGYVCTDAVLLLCSSHQSQSQEIRAGWKRVFSRSELAFITKTVSKKMTSELQQPSCAEVGQQSWHFNAARNQSKRYDMSVVENPGHFDLSYADIFEIRQSQYLKNFLKCIFNSRVNLNTCNHPQVGIKRTRTKESYPLEPKRSKNTKKSYPSTGVFFKSIKPLKNNLSNSRSSTNKRVDEAVRVLMSLKYKY
tara:strand:- start:808 stop:2079 length:1272 start_codon:yes stop_codon:yes gene_type:complete